MSSLLNGAISCSYTFPKDIYDLLRHGLEDARDGVGTLFSVQTI